MLRSTNVLDRLWRELEASPLLPIPELARKYAVPEGMIFEHLRSKGVAKVRKDCVDLVMERILDWGCIQLRIRNDWASVEFPVASDLLHRTERGLSMERDGVRLSIRFNSVAAIYFLEDVPSCPPTVVFCNKRGRCVFEVSVARARDPLRMFLQTRDSTCIGNQKGPPPGKGARP